MKKEIEDKIEYLYNKYHSSLRDLRPLYKIYTIKTNSKNRNIEEPVEILKEFQKDFLEVLYNLYEPPPNVTSIRGMSILDNATPHQGAKAILKIDIKDFYRNTSEGKTIKGLSTFAGLSTPNINNIFSWFIGQCFTTENKRQFYLPTGAPTSPILSNIAMLEADRLIQIEIDQMGLIYTRYFDDITLSIHKDGFYDPPAFPLKLRIADILYSYGYEINNRKSKWIYPNTKDKYEVTGIRIATEPGQSRVPRELRRKTKYLLEQCAKEGRFLDDRVKGYLSFIQSIDPVVFTEISDYYKKRMDHWNAINP